MYFALMQQKEVKLEHIRLITLLNRVEKLQADLHEVLQFIKEDLECLTGKIDLIINEQQIEEGFQLKIVIGDLQGLP